MQSCTRAARRSACGAYNAYSLANAVRSTFVTTLHCRQKEDHDPIPKQQSLATDAGAPPREERSNVPHNPSEAPQVAEQVVSKAPWRKIEGGVVYRQPSRFTAASDGSLLWLDKLLTHGPSQRLATSPGDQFKIRLSSRQWQRHIAKLRDRMESLKTSEGHKKLRELSEEQQHVLRQEFDYIGNVIHPHESRIGIPEPWALTRTEVNKIMTDVGSTRDNASYRMLSLEIQRFAEYMTPTPVERAARQAIAEEIQDFITTTLLRDHPGKTGCEIFGSEKTGLAMPLSDIDIRIFDTTDRPEMRGRMDGRMGYLHAELRSSDKYILAVLRKSGRYPIINCQHRESGIDIQIVASPETSRQQEITTKYLARLPCLRPLFYIVRTMFAMRGLLDVYAGGLGSYGTFIMVLAQMNRSQSRRSASKTLSSYLCQFFTDYDETNRHGIRTSEQGIAVFPRFKFLKHDADKCYRVYNRLALKRGDPVRAAQWTMCQRKPLQPYLLTLQDPADPKNDLGKKSNAIKHILATISHQRYLLKVRRRKTSQRLKNGEEDDDNSFLLPIVGKCHEIYAEPRRRLREYGEKVLSLKGSGGQREHEVSQPLGKE